MPYICQATLDLGERQHEAILAALSPARMAGYIAAVPAGGLKQAIALYAYNQTLSGLFFELLANIEVTLRNRIHQQFSARYGRSDWFETVQPMLSDARARDIDDALYSIRRGGDAPSAGRVIAKLSFGFWVALFEIKHIDRFWTPTLRHIFPPIQVRKLHADLRAIRDLRNSIAHHERILKYDLRNALAQAETILQMISPATADWSRARLSMPMRACMDEMDAYRQRYRAVDPHPNKI